MKHPHEPRLLALLLAQVGTRPRGEIVIDADDGVLSTTGFVESGLLRRSRRDAGDLWTPEMSSTVFDAYEASKASSEGAWYRCRVLVTSASEVAFSYFHQREALKDIAGIPRDSLGSLPGFVFRARFDRELLALIDDGDISTAILYFVPAELARGGAVSEELLSLYATVDWQGDTNNGSLNQYFARAQDPYGGLDRARLYGATLAGLELIGHDEAVALFREALAAYSEFHERVDAVREQLGIARLPSGVESDVINAYWDIERQVETVRAAYVRANLGMLVGGG
jgi:hypothetical protein